MVLHKEFNQVCEFAKTHKKEKFCTADADRQETHRASQLVAFCVPAMAKIQADERFKDVADSNDAVIKAFNLLNINIEKIDLNRSMKAFLELENVFNPIEEISTPEQAVVDATLQKAVLTYIADQIKAEKPKDEVKKLLISLGNSEELVNAHLNFYGNAWNYEQKKPTEFKLPTEIKLPI